MTVGRHLLAELYDCDRATIDDVDRMVELARKAVTESKGTILAVQSHKFEPQGVTALVLIAESHLALHTWPEHGYVAFDYFTCGERIDPEVALRTLLDALRPSRSESRVVDRGQPLT